MLMEIVLKRIAKKNSYTIGRLYILKDEEVESVVHSSWMNPQLKRWFEHKIDAGKLTQECYFCDTLEPTWRNLKGVELQPEEVNVRLGRVSGKKAQKMKGTTAIPEGTYPLLVTKSPRFKEWLQLPRRYPGLHPGGREQGEGHGGELPYLAASPDEMHQRSERKE